MGDESEQIIIYENVQFGSGLAHLILTGAAGNAISLISYDEQPYAYIAACTLFTHGMFGILVKTHSALSWHHHLKPMYEWINLTSKSMLLPLINCEMGKKTMEDDIYMYAHVASGLAPLVYGIGCSTFGYGLTARTERILDIVVLGNVCTLGYSGTKQKSSLALTAAFWQMFSQFIPVVFEQKIDTKKFDIETYGLTVLAFILGKMFGSMHGNLID